MRKCRAFCDSASTPEGTRWTTTRRSILVIGAGDATGGAIARRFAREGYVACVTRRSADKLQPLVEQIRADGGKAHGFGSDARKEDEVVALVEQIERDIGPIEVAVFNIGANVRFQHRRDDRARLPQGLGDGRARRLPDGPRGRQARWLPRGRGTIIFTGATASVRGSAGFAAFAGAKHALRALAQSMARELGPQGIHVAHVVIDGAIDTDFIAENFPERYALKEQDGILEPGRIAENYWKLHRQPRERLDARARPAALDGELVSMMSDNERSSSSSTSAARPRTSPGRSCRRSPPRRGAAIVWRPMLLGGVFKATGNAQPGDGAGQGPLDERRPARWARRYGVPFSFNPHFPINTLTLMRGAVGLQMRRPARLPALRRRRRSARCGTTPKNLGDPAVLAATLADAGFDADEFIALVGRPARSRRKLVATTEEAVARGVFGAPTFFVGERCSSARTASTSSARRCSRFARKSVRMRRLPERRSSVGAAAASRRSSRRTHARAACRARPANAPPAARASDLEIRAQLPDLGEQHDVEHLAQVADAAGAAGAALEADHALDRRHVAEAPEPEHVLEVGQLLAELVQVPVRLRVAVDDEPGLLDAFARRVGLRSSRARRGSAGTGRPRRASRRSASS